jgi:predicted RNase H-like HicB family nuclease
MKYAIAIEPGTPTAAFGVAVPDLPGCFSAGDSVEEAYDNAVEAIEGFCELLAKDGKDLPARKPLSEWQADPEFAGWVWGMVDADVEKLFGPAEKINITVPPVTLRAIDRFAGQQGLTRSAFLVRAAEVMMMQANSYGAPVGFQAGTPQDQPWSAVSAAATATRR